MRLPLIAVAGLTSMIGQRTHELCTDLTWEQLAVDITDQAAVDAAIAGTSAETVVNLAAYTDVGSAQSQYGDTGGSCYRINVTGTANLARATAKAGKRFVHVSTDYVFEGDRDGPYLETDEGDAETDWYGCTKRLAERAVHESSGAWAVVRLSFPYLRSSVRKVDLVRRIRSQLQAGALPPMFTDQTITPTFGDDVARILARVVRTKAEGTFHAVGPEWLTPHQVAVQVARSLGLDASLVPASSLQGYTSAGGRPFPRSLRISSTTTVQALGQTPTSLGDALRLPGWRA